MAGTVTASIVKNDTTSPPAFQNSAGTEIGQLCRAWVNFNGLSGASPVVRASFNVSSVTRSATGDYTVNFTTSLADANYSVVSIGCSYALTNVQIVVNTAGSTNATVLNNKTASSVRLLSGFGSTGGAVDLVDVNVSVFR